VNYVPNGSAVLLKSSFPSFRDDSLTWIQEWNHDVLLSGEGYLLMIYPKAGGEGLKPEGDGTFPHFISPDFNAHGKTYRQLSLYGEWK
jgi:hypothetical protein